VHPIGRQRSSNKCSGPFRPNRCAQTRASSAPSEVSSITGIPDASFDQRCVPSKPSPYEALPGVDLFRITSVARSRVSVALPATPSTHASLWVTTKRGAGSDQRRDPWDRRIGGLTRDIARRKRNKRER